MTHTRKLLYLIPVLLFSVMAPVLCAADAGKTVIKRGIVNDDMYVAGRIVDIQADVRGDVVAAGQDVSIDKSVRGDVMAAGEMVEIRATVADDVRAAGRKVTLTGRVGGHMVAAGESIHIRSSAAIGSWARFAGERIDIAGDIGRDVKAIGNTITVAGKVAGDVVLVAEHIEILAGAIIRGQLIYHSPNKPQVHPGARIVGGMVERPMPAFADEDEKDQTGAAFLLGISLMISCLVYFLVLPRFSLAAAGTINSNPWKSLALGFALLVAVPFVILLLLITLIGHQLALVLLALYLVSLLLGFLTGVLYIANTGLRLFGKREAIAKWLRSLSIVVALIVLGIVAAIPLLGALVIFLLLLFGLGALNLKTWRVYQAA